MTKALYSIPLLMALQILSIACTKQEVQQWIDGSGGAAVAQNTGFQKSTDAEPTEAFNMVGSSGAVTSDQLAKLFYLSWPQSGEAMVDLLGQPAQRDQTRDFYRMPNGHWLVIYYDPTGAYGFSMGDSDF